MLGLDRAHDLMSKCGSAVWLKALNTAAVDLGEATILHIVREVKTFTLVVRGEPSTGIAIIWRSLLL